MSDTNTPNGQTSVTIEGITVVRVGRITATGPSVSDAVQMAAITASQAVQEKFFTTALAAFNKWLKRRPASIMAMFDIGLSDISDKPKSEADPKA